MWWYAMSNAFMRLYRGQRRRGRVVQSTVPEVAARVWGEVASARGLAEIAAENGPLLSFTGTVRGVPCTLDLLEVPGSIVPRTRVAATRHDDGQWLRVGTASAARRLGATLAGRRVATGDAGFDAAFVARGDGAVLDEVVRAALEAVGPRYPELRVAGAEVELTMEGAELVHECLGAVLDAVVRIASREA
jgi:hypothetical protein